MISNTLRPIFPYPTSPVTSGDFLFIAQKQKLQKQRWRNCRLGRQQEGAGPGPVLPFIPLCPPQLDARDLGIREAWGFAAKRTVVLSRAVLEGVSPGLEGAKSCKGAELPSQGPKASRVGGRPLVWQLRRGGFGRQDAGLFTVGSPGPSKPPRGMGQLFTQQGKRKPGAQDQALCSPLP